MFDVAESYWFKSYFEFNFNAYLLVMYFGTEKRRKNVFHVPIYNVLKYNFTFKQKCFHEKSFYENFHDLMSQADLSL